jgi:pimeloyl-ACP methyl ester carboxylesterase
MTIELTHHVTTVSGVRLHYATAGTGRPVLLLAGWPQTSYAWRKVVPLLVAENRRVVLLDLRGQGDSAKPDHGYDLDTLAGDVYAVARHLNLLDTDGLDIVSHDVGSWVAYALACARPQDIRRLVLSEMTVQTPDTHRPLPDAKQNIASWHFGFNRLPDLPEQLIAGRERTFIDWLLDHKSSRPEAIDEAAREHYATAFAAPGAARAGFSYYRALLAPEGLARMAERVTRRLEMPVLAVGGTGGVGPRLAESLHAATRELESVVLDAGHYLPEEVPEEFTHVVLDWWKRHP